AQEGARGLSSPLGRRHRFGSAGDDHVAGTDVVNSYGESSASHRLERVAGSVRRRLTVKCPAASRDRARTEGQAQHLGGISVEGAVRDAVVAVSDALNDR